MVHMRVDEKIKTRASRALSAMGPSISDAVRVLLTRVAAEQRLPLESKIPNVETRAAMSETDEILRGRRARCRMADELFDDLAQDSGKYARGVAPRRELLQDIPQRLGAALALRALGHQSPEGGDPACSSATTARWARSGRTTR